MDVLAQANLARYIVTAVVTEGRSYRQTAHELGVSKSLVAKIISRYREGGIEATAPRSRAPRSIPARCPPELEQRIVELRGELISAGFDAGATTIHTYLERENPSTPSITTIHRVLVRRGLVTRQPHKRPKSSWIRFEAHLPNECWQADVTHWKLADGSDVEILDILDDHSRLMITSKAMRVATSVGVVTAFRSAFDSWGKPASILTDNGCVFTAWHRGGMAALEIECLEEGIELKHSRPNHPTTCGKVEHVHQTVKRFLRSQPPAQTIEELQAQLDFFTDHYNHIRPHRAKNRTTPRSAYDARAKAYPIGVKIPRGAGVRVRQDRVDKAGKITLRRKGTLHHIGIGRDHARKRVVVLVNGLEIRVITRHGELLRELTLDPTKVYQPTGRPRNHQQQTPHPTKQASTMP